MNVFCSTKLNDRQLRQVDATTTHLKADLWSAVKAPADYFSCYRLSNGSGIKTRRSNSVTYAPPHSGGETALPEKWMAQPPSDPISDW